MRTFVPVVWTIVPKEQLGDDTAFIGNGGQQAARERVFERRTSLLSR